MVEIMDERFGKRSVERVRYVTNNLLHLVIVKYGAISLVLCISTRLRLMTILASLMIYVIIFHADPCYTHYRASELIVVFFKNKIERGEGGGEEGGNRTKPTDLSIYPRL